MTQTLPKCLYCESDSDQVPLLALQYRGETIWICPQHLPILIHKPSQLGEVLPGAESFGPPAEHGH